MVKAEEKRLRKVYAQREKLGTLEAPVGKEAKAKREEAIKDEAHETAFRKFTEMKTPHLAKAMSKRRMSDKDYIKERMKEDGIPTAKEAASNAAEKALRARRRKK